jgi:Family of unknown function (DUF6636)
VPGSRAVAPVIVATVLAASLAACGTSGSPQAKPADTPTPSSSTPTPSSTPSSVPRGALVQLDDLASPPAGGDSFSLPAPTTARGSGTIDLGGEDLPGFTTPSGNIGCLFDDYQGPHVRSDRLQMNSVPGGKPADCDFDWGHSVELYAAGAGGLACTSDSVMGLQGQTDGSRVLAYDRSVRYRGIACLSTMKGLLCVNGGGHGFVLARAGIRAG